MLLAKIVLVPLLIGLLSVAGRRWGPVVGGWLAGLPWTSGPVAFFLAIDHGTGFAANAALGTMMGLISVAGFCVVYAMAARTQGWVVSVLAGWTAFFVVTAALTGVAVSLGGALMATAAVLLAATVVVRADAPADVAGLSPWWEIPLRMAAALAMVLAITGAAASLGPRLSGLLSPFPIFATVLAAFTHRLKGAAASIRLLRGVLIGSFSFALFFVILAATLTTWGVAPAFGAAVAGALVTHAIGLRVIVKSL
jgi:hypothetical protein